MKTLDLDRLIHQEPFESMKTPYRDRLTLIRKQVVELMKPQKYLYRLIQTSDSMNLKEDQQQGHSHQMTLNPNSTLYLQVLEEDHLQDQTLDLRVLKEDHLPDLTLNPRVSGEDHLQDQSRNLETKSVGIVSICYQCGPYPIHRTCERRIQAHT